MQCGAAARLRARARGRGWRVHVADLHWRSPLEQQRDHRFPVLCIAELARELFIDVDQTHLTARVMKETQR